MKKMEKKKAEKRRAIISAAQEVFQARGYVKSNMDIIARKAGVTKQTLYRYFTSKETLFQASLESRRRGTRDQFLRELDREDANEALTQFAIGFIKVHTSETHLSVIRLLVAEGARAPEIAGAHFAMGSEKVVTRLTRFFRERFGADDPGEVIEAFLATLLSRRMDILIGLRENPSQEEIERHAARTVQLMMRLVP